MNPLGVAGKPGSNLSPPLTRGTRPGIRPGLANSVLTHPAPKRTGRPTTVKPPDPRIGTAGLGPWADTLPGSPLDRRQFRSQFTWMHRAMTEQLMPLTAKKKARLARKGLVVYDENHRLVAVAGMKGAAEARFDDLRNAGQKWIRPLLQGEWYTNFSGFNPRAGEIQTNKNHADMYASGTTSAVVKAFGSDATPDAHGDDGAAEVWGAAVSAWHAGHILGVTLKKFKAIESGKKNILLASDGAQRCLDSLGLGQEPALVDAVEFLTFWGELPGWNHALDQLATARKNADKDQRRLQKLARERGKADMQVVTSGFGRDVVLAPGIGGASAARAGAHVAEGMGHQVVEEVAGAVAPVGLLAMAMDIFQGSSEARAAYLSWKLLGWRLKQLKALEAKGELNEVQRLMLSSLKAYCKAKRDIAKREFGWAVGRITAGIGRGAGSGLALAGLVGAVAGGTAGTVTAAAVAPPVLGAALGFGSLVLMKRQYDRFVVEHEGKWDQRDANAMIETLSFMELREAYVAGFRAQYRMGDFNPDRQDYRGLHDKFYEGGGNDAMTQYMLVSDILDSFERGAKTDCFSMQVLIGVGLDPVSKLVLGCAVRALLRIGEKATARSLIGSVVRRLFDFLPPRPNEPVHPAKWAVVFEHAEGQLGDLHEDVTHDDVARKLFGPGGMGANKAAFKASMRGLRKEFEHVPPDSPDEGLGVFRRMLAFDAALTVQDEKVAPQVAARLVAWDKLAGQEWGSDALKQAYLRIRTLLDLAKQYEADAWELQIQKCLHAERVDAGVHRLLETVDVLKRDLALLADSGKLTKDLAGFASQLETELQIAQFTHAIHKKKVKQAYARTGKPLLGDTSMPSTWELRQSRIHLLVDSRSRSFNRKERHQLYRGITGDLRTLLEANTLDDEQVKMAHAFLEDLHHLSTGSAARRGKEHGDVS